ncbi:MAG: CarD family transcriptional regulator, partial [Alphaproteobacteria bacterium]|nr:CarD family transcriptional regulator [Alphaproteobacteria bacterium]
MEPNELKEMLFIAGYENSVVTESVGEVTSRAGIIDIFPPNLDNPVRVDFFDDEIESIREFDNISQRSLQKLEKVSIFPAVDFIPTEKEKDIAFKNLIKTDNQIAELIKNGADPQIFSDYFQHFELENNYIWNYLENGISIVIEPEIIRQQIDDSKLFNKFSNIFSANCAVFSSLQESIKEIDKFDKITNIKSGQVVSFNGNLNLLSSEIKNYLKRKYLVNIVSSSKERSDRIREYLEIENIYGNISYKLGALTSGMVLEDEKICYITENDIFPQSNKKNKRKKKKTKDSIEFSDLHSGDYVVHEEHGIGKFEGIKTITADGQKRDYLEIRYAGTDVLYIPTEQLDVIQRYIGSGGHGPALSRLSGGSWRNTKEKARKAIMEIAEDLVKLYAERKESGGHAFPEDNVWQTEFEEAFPYTETDDQLNAILEIKEDMMKPLPMDRLLCGDVGYGKTEVAARAIFKCLSEGKQVAFLAPTTLLVNQHYHNFIERFEGFPFEIGELSRFRTKAQQQKIIRGLENGSVDFVVGTHRLLSDDVKFKDLGLLVVDEEQRFGVQHKEKIKKLRNNVDVLTLSATPIPRTLNMSLTGIKDITTINEPPGERYPVQTFVNSYDENVIKTALDNELNRGGQVFVINNRITGINKIVQKISELKPNANIGVCHGRMTEIALENTMKDFIDGKINVLVSTTIIENGIDIPNANTII